MTPPPDPRSPKGKPTDSMRELLGRHVYLTLATRNADGSQHVVPVVYLFRKRAVPRGSRKARNLAADPQVTVTVDDRSAIQWVSAVGTAELLTGPESRAVNHRLYRLWMTDEGLDTVGSLMHEVEDVTVVITPHRWLSWSFESDVAPKLTAAGIPLDDPARWFRF